MASASVSATCLHEVRLLSIFTPPLPITSFTSCSFSKSDFSKQQVRPRMRSSVFAASSGQFSLADKSNAFIRHFPLVGASAMATPAAPPVRRLRKHRISHWVNIYVNIFALIILRELNVLDKIRKL